MVRKSKGVYGKWNEEDLKNAVAAVENGASVSSAAKEFSIPRKTLEGHVKKGGEPKKQFGRPPVLSAQQEDELTGRIIRLQQVGFGVTRAQVQSMVFQYCTQNNLTNTFTKGHAGRYWFIGFQKRHPELVFRKGEGLSYGRLMKFNEETVRQFYSLLQKTIEEMSLSNNPMLIYNVDETGLQLTFAADKVPVLALKGTKRVHIATHGEKGETVTVLACVNATGSNWIPPMIIYKGKNRKEAWGDGLPPGSIFEMTPKGYINTDTFCRFINQFNANRLPGKALLILDGHRSHVDIRVVDVAESCNIQILCLPAHCSHELQPLDKSVFRSLKMFWNEAVDNYRRTNPGRSLSKLQFPQIFTKAWMKTATPKNAVSGFKATGIFPFNPDVISEDAFAPSNISERPLPPNSPDVPVQLDTNSATEEGNITSNVSSVIQSTPVSDMSSSVSGSASLNVSFHDIMSSPKIRRSIRKSINSQAILVTKNLFTTVSKSKSGKSKKTIGPIADIDLQEAGPSGVETRKKRKKYEANICGDCREDYYDPKGRKVEWIRCTMCKKWFHEDCHKGSVQNYGLCTVCYDAYSSDSDESD